MNNSNSTFVFWSRWLTAASIVVVAFGASMVLAPSLASRFFGLLIYASPDAIPKFGASALSYITLTHGVLGAVMVGWGTALMFVTLGPFRRATRDGWLTLAVSIAAWFIPDTVLSLWFGFWQNGVLNLLLGRPIRGSAAKTQPKNNCKSTAEARKTLRDHRRDCDPRISPCNGRRPASKLLSALTR